MDVMRFKEIEHKFIVDEGFDAAALGRRLEAIGPSRRTALLVRDRYFQMVGRGGRPHVIRHRFDAELHHLTVKSIANDPEVRDEVSIDLGHHMGAQEAQVEAFVLQVGAAPVGVIDKQINVWSFPQCEVVYYVASNGTRSVGCVEFEAMHAVSVPEALAILERFERATGFDAAARCRLSLPEILFPDAFAR